MKSAKALSVLFLLTLALPMGAQAALTADENGYLPGSLSDRQSGEAVRLRCLDSGCTNLVYSLMNEAGKEVKSSYYTLTKIPGTAYRDGEVQSKPMFYLTGYAAIGSVMAFGNDSSALGVLLIPLIPVGIALDIASLPVTAISAIDVANYKAKLGKFHEKNVTITHKRFARIKSALFR